MRPWAIIRGLGDPQAPVFVRLNPQTHQETLEASVDVGVVVQLVPDGSPVTTFGIGIPKISSYPSAVLIRHYTDTPPLSLLLQGNIYYRSTPYCFISRVLLGSFE